MPIIRIVNGGEASHLTKITNERTGEEIPNVSNIEISIDANQHFPKAILTIVMPAIDVTVNAEIRRICPCCGSILVEDGVDC